jgi:hypothetical protein
MAAGGTGKGTRTGAERAGVAGQQQRERAEGARRGAWVVCAVAVLTSLGCGVDGIRIQWLTALAFGARSPSQLPSRPGRSPRIALALALALVLALALELELLPRTRALVSSWPSPALCYILFLPARA